MVITVEDEIIENEIKAKILSKLQSDKKKLVLVHQNADIDAVACAYILYHFFDNISVGSFTRVSSLGQKLKDVLGLEISLHPVIEDYDILVVVDTSSPMLLGTDSSKLTEAIVIDHHGRSDQWKNELYLCDEDASSCSELFYKLLEPVHNARTELNRDVATAFLAGILTDTGRFRYANANTFKTTAELISRSNVSINSVLEMLEMDASFDSSRKIAHLKGAQRMRYITAGDYIIAFSEVSSFEASVCNSLILLGADIAFVGAQRKNEVRLSARAKEAPILSGLNLGRFLSGVASKFNCEGGGHEGAAGLNGLGSIQEILGHCEKQIIELLLNSEQS